MGDNRMDVLACAPQPGFGTVEVRRGARVEIVDLATCRSHTAQAPAIRIRVCGRTVVLGSSPDRKWRLFAIDPMSSMSVAADGPSVKAVSVRTKRTHTIGPGLIYGDYRAWCGDRMSTHVRVLVHDPRRAFGALHRLTSPPPGSDDDAPHVTPDGKILFVRTRDHVGTLYGLGAGPLVRVGRDPQEYYGRRGWANVSLVTRR